jgi:protein-S-isoprenylcysteine O-methyltransferase Ste14
LVGETNVERCFVLVWWNRIGCGSLLMLGSSYMYWLILSMAHMADYFRNLFWSSYFRGVGGTAPRALLTQNGKIGAPMPGFLHSLSAFPKYGLAAFGVLLLYVVQSEVRFGQKARMMLPGSADRSSTLALSLGSAIPVFGFVMAIKAHLPRLLGPIPGMPAVAWVGVASGAVGLIVRLWSVLTLRDRYTRTLLIGSEQTLERGGPYRFVRHPGYLGSLLCLNGIALASGDLLVVIASLAATGAAYAYRIHVEDAMLIERFGLSYVNYRRQVRALIPFAPAMHGTDEVKQ